MSLEYFKVLRAYARAGLSVCCVGQFRQAARWAGQIAKDCIFFGKLYTVQLAFVPTACVSTCGLSKICG